MEESITPIKSKLKVDFIVIGNQNSGKTSLIKRYILGESTTSRQIDSFSHFYTPTVGLNLEKKIIKLQDQQITVCIWDTAGQEKFFALTKNYFKKADGVLIIFDVTDRITFERIQKYWMQQIKDKSDENCFKVLIGNKVDLLEERQVKYSEAKELAERYKLQYFQTSAKTGEQVQQCFAYLAKQCAENIKDTEPSSFDFDKPVAKKSSSCFDSLKNIFAKILDK